jgi:type II secretory pathway pseudopilin PulG
MTCRDPPAAFTLIELLVVIGIVMVLSGMLLTALGPIRAQARRVQCSNQLRQLGMAISTYAGQHDDHPPPRLRALFAAGGELAGADKLLICPEDVSRGGNGLNRTPPSWGTLDDLWQPEKPCSYLYETSESQLDAATLAYFYRDFVEQSQPLPTDPAETTWEAGKRHYPKHGNVRDDGSGLRGAPFDASGYPIVRCYWHHHWTEDNAGSDRKVLNVSWDGNVFPSIPKWEHEANPLIPLGERFVDRTGR